MTFQLRKKDSNMPEKGLNFDPSFKLDTLNEGEKKDKNPSKFRMVDVLTAANMAGLSVRHFRRLIKEGEIPVVELGARKTQKVLLSELEKWKDIRRQLQEEDDLKAVYSKVKRR
jgi:hypothetical protein